MDNAAPPSDLVIRASQGDPAAGGTLLGLTQTALRGYFRNRLRHCLRCPVDDLVQETCLGIWIALRRGEPDPDTYWALVYGIAANKLVDAYRRNERDHSGRSPLPTRTR